MGEGLVGMSDEVAKQFKFLRRQPDLSPAYDDAAGLKIDINLPFQRDPLGRLIQVERRAAQGGADAGEQFGRAEGLGHIVVGASVERAHLVPFDVANGEHEDGGVRT